MSEEKMGTHYVREMAESFRKIAGQTQFPVIKEKLLALADEMEPLAGKLFFKTQKGTEDMQAMAAELGDLNNKLNACAQAEAAQSMCIPFFMKLEKVIEHVKTMRVRMT
jgi:hypothetical protein